METINESIIRKIVAESLKKALMENIEGEYRTKGSLNKSTLAKNAEKSEEETLADSEKQQENADDYNPDWDDSIEDIMAKYKKNDDYDDSQAGGEYKIDKYDPYFFDKEGNRCTADAIGNFHNDFAIVKCDEKVNYIDKDGVVLSDDWFDACNDFEDGFGLVMKDRKKNFICSNGSLLLDTWVDRAGDFVAGEAPVIINGQMYRVNRRGEIM